MSTWILALTAQIPKASTTTDLGDLFGFNDHCVSLLPRVEDPQDMPRKSTQT